MDKNKFKSYIWIILFFVGLVLFVIHFNDILGFLGDLIVLLKPFFIGTLIAFVLYHPYRWFKNLFSTRCHFKNKVAHISAVVFVYILTLGLLTLLLGMLVPELVKNINLFINDADQYLSSIQSLVNQFCEYFHLPPVDLSNIINLFRQMLNTFSSSFDETLSQILKMTENLISAIATICISIIFSIYLLDSKDKLITQIRSISLVYIPMRIYENVKEIFTIIANVFDDYLTGQCKEALILGFLCFIGMMILHLNYALLISSIIAITALIPMLGAYIGGGLGVLLLLFISPFKALVFLIFLIILQQIEGNIIYPKVVGNKLSLPGIWVLVGITIGGEAFGIWGMFLAVPITTIFYRILKQDVERKGYPF